MVDLLEKRVATTIERLSIVARSPNSKPIIPPHEGPTRLLPNTANHRLDIVGSRQSGRNELKGQMLAGLEAGTAAVESGAVLATLVFQASKDAAGVFVIDVLQDEAAGDQTFLIGGGNERIAVEPAVPMRIEVSERIGRAR